MLLCSSSGAEALKLSVTDVKEWQQACLFFKRAHGYGGRNAEDTTRIFFLAKGYSKDTLQPPQCSVNPSVKLQFVVVKKGTIHR